MHTERTPTTKHALLPRNLDATGREILVHRAATAVATVGSCVVVVPLNPERSKRGRTKRSVNNLHRLYLLARSPLPSITREIFASAPLFYLQIKQTLWLATGEIADARLLSRRPRSAPRSLVSRGLEQQCSTKSCEPCGWAMGGCA